MTNMLNTITPKSDQLNFDDLIGGQTKTIKITKVSIKQGEQPVSLHYEGDNGKPYKPCKSMCRVMVHLWGPDANNYAGRSMTLYGDPNVKFGGLEVGGIRISHMSDIKGESTMALTVTRANKKPFTIRPLVEAPPTAGEEPKPDPVLEGIRTRGAGVAALGTASLQEWWSNLDPKYQKALASDKGDWKKVAKEFDEKRDEQNEGMSQ